MKETSMGQLPHMKMGKAEEEEYYCSFILICSEMAANIFLSRGKEISMIALLVPH